MNIMTALNRVVHEAPSDFAKAYAKVALEMPLNPEAFHTQLVYVKANLATWRGDRAKEAKACIEECLAR